MDTTTTNVNTAGKALMSEDLNGFAFKSKEENLHYEGVFDVDPIEISENLETVLLIDVRQPSEFNGELGHIPGSQHIVLDELEDKIDTLPRDKDIIFVCRSGSRSAKSTQIALNHGLKRVFNLKGGMLLWNELHLTTELTFED